MISLKHSADGYEVSMEIEGGHTWEKMLDLYRNFLNSIGYIMPMGDIIVNDLEPRGKCEGECCKRSQEERKFTIEGPGLYRTRNDAIVRITRFDEDSISTPWCGYIMLDNDLINNITWSKEGKWFPSDKMQESQWDIVEKINKFGEWDFIEEINT